MGTRDVCNCAENTGHSFVEVTSPALQDGHYSLKTHNFSKTIQHRIINIYIICMLLFAHNHADKRCILLTDLKTFTNQRRIINNHEDRHDYQPLKTAE